MCSYQNKAEGKTDKVRAKSHYFGKTKILTTDILACTSYYNIALLVAVANGEV